ncbi:MAG TPA: hypothetical protein VLV18_03505 [Terriglobales bacterium]|nr:hypothetical protein [Terriglobales bacterium]
MFLREASGNFPFLTALSKLRREARLGIAANAISSTFLVLIRPQTWTRQWMVASTCSVVGFVGARSLIVCVR